MRTRSSSSGFSPSSRAWRALFDRPDGFVAGDLFWHPVHGDPTTVPAPDVMVAFGRPKGHRGRDKQWQEGSIAPQGVIEVRSPGNTVKGLDETFAFYDQFGVEEYHLYDPLREVLHVWVRSGASLAPVSNPSGFVSPRLGVRFDMPAGGPLRPVRPDGRPFLTYAEVIAAAETERRWAAKLAAKLRELGVDPDAV